MEESAKPKVVMLKPRLLLEAQGLADTDSTGVRGGVGEAQGDLWS